MSFICSLICCCNCCKRQKSKRWEDQQSITPSLIPDSLLTKEYKVPSDDGKYKFEEEVMTERDIDYNSRQLIGEGGFAKVYKLKTTKDKKVVAMKVITLKGVENERDDKKYKNLKNEIFVMFKIKHENIVELIDTFIINNFCYIVMEFAIGGTVEEEITKCGPMTETNAKIYFIQMSRAVQRLHLNVNPIAHRDIKPANFLIQIKDNNKIIKLTDFGFSKVLDQKHENKIFRARKAEGTLPYMSPQTIALVLLNNPLNTKQRDRVGKVKTVNPIKADIWSLGVCLYVMINGYLPLETYSNEVPILLKIIEDLKHMKFKPFKQNISPELRDLINQMLEPKTANRIDITAIIKHKWLKDVTKEEEFPKKDLTKT